jgi:hypothetical protein
MCSFSIQASKNLQVIQGHLIYGNANISPDANSIHWVHIIRPMAITHSCDTEQRLVDLPISQRGLSVTAVVTDNPNLAPAWLVHYCEYDVVNTTLQIFDLEKKRYASKVSSDVEEVLGQILLTVCQRLCVGFLIVSATKRLFRWCSLGAPTGRA